MRATILTAMVFLACSFTTLPETNPSGLWKGIIYGETLSDIGLDLRINESNHISGFVRCYVNENDYTESEVDGSYDPKTKRMIFKETRLVKTNVKGDYDFLPGRFDLQMEKMFPYNLRGYYHCTDKSNSLCKKNRAVEIRRFVTR